MKKKKAKINQIDFQMNEKLTNKQKQNRAANEKPRNTEQQCI